MGTLQLGTGISLLGGTEPGSIAVQVCILALLVVISGSMAFKRRYTNGTTDSFALVTVTGDATYTGIPNGTYRDAVTGDVKAVSNGTLSVPAPGKGNLRVYVLNGPGKIGADGPYLK